MKRLLLLCTLVAFTLGIGSMTLVSPVWGQDIDDMIAKAKSPADHEAIAAYYDKEAAAAEAKAAQHKKMAETYIKLRPDHPAGPEGSHLKPLPAHCEAVAKSYEAVAKEDRALAEAHRKMAKAEAK